MAKEKFVEVELKTACLVDGVKRKAGDKVFLPESVAASFAGAPRKSDAKVETTKAPDKADA